MGKRQISFFIDNDLWKKFSMKCIEKDTNKTSVLVKAITEYVNQK